MSSPPSFTDLGKSAKDLFGKGFHHGFVKFDSTTKSGPQVEFKTGAAHNLTAEKLIGNLEIKYKVPQHGFTITEKWNTDNNLGTVIEVKDQFMRGNKVTFDIAYNPNTGRRNALVKSEWAAPQVKVNADANIISGPVFNVSAVGLLQPNWYIGGLIKFDMPSKQMKNHSLAIGHITNDYTLHSYVNDGQEFGGSFYHQVNKNFEMGAQMSWLKVGGAQNNNNINFALASKYRVSQDLTVQSKIDKNANVAISATHDLGGAVKLTFSTHFGLTKVDGQKFGLGLEYKPACCH